MKLVGGTHHDEVIDYAFFEHGRTVELPRRLDSITEAVGVADVPTLVPVNNEKYVCYRVWFNTDDGRQKFDYGFHDSLGFDGTTEFRNVFLFLMGYFIGKYDG